MGTAASLSGPNVGLQVAQYLYPSELTNAPVDFGSNRLSLAPGDILALPRGNWLVDPGLYGVIWYRDPTTGEITIASDAGWNGGIQEVASDGFNVGVANLTGCPVNAVVTNGGSGYAQATTTLAPSLGTSTWNPVIGGALSASISAAGGNYGVAPLVLIPAPPGPDNNPNGVGGVAAQAYAVITGGSVTAISFTNQGAGYPVAPVVTIVPSPLDPNLNSSTNPITQASVTMALTGAGTLTAALCTNNGIALSDANVGTGVTLTVTGAGSSAAATVNILSTIKALGTVSAAGVGYSNPAKLTTTGGIPTASTLTTPFSLNQAWQPRPADISLAASGGSVSSISAINDGGFFLGQAPSPIIIGGAPTTAAAVTLTRGGVPVIMKIQPGP
ncbi:MAG: hypothetical protein KGL39_07615 [Patescibacteria group bacterium]|nr:hypothetical protein [Patescibacteria group bacterium]